MIRGKLVEKEKGLADFRWRGREVSRLEGFSDAVFAFAVTLLVVSLEVPRSFDELLNAMRGFLAFAICFCILYMIWIRHYMFFRRYGLSDGPTIVLNGFLLFVILFFVYPLKFVFTLFVASVFKLQGTGLELKLEQVPTLFMIYGAGFATVYLIFALMHWNALRKSDELELDEYERASTKLVLQRELWLVNVGLASIALALFLPLSYSPFSGFAYFAVGLVEGKFGAKEGDLRRTFSVNS